MGMTELIARLRDEMLETGEAVGYCTRCSAVIVGAANMVDWSSDDEYGHAWEEGGVTVTCGPLIVVEPREVEQSAASAVPDVQAITPDDFADTMRTIAGSGMFPGDIQRAAANVVGTLLESLGYSEGGRILIGLLT